VRTLTPTVLTPEAFAPYGDVISSETAADAARSVIGINYGQTTRFHDLAAVDTGQQGGRTGISLFRTTPLALPIRVQIMECHPVGSQAFIPLSGHPYLVVVAPSKISDPTQPDWDQLTAFMARPGQGVNYHPGTWHHYSLALDGESDFLVIDRIADGEDGSVNLIEVEAPFDIQLDL